MSAIHFAESGDAHPAGIVGNFVPADAPLLTRDGSLGASSNKLSCGSLWMRKKAWGSSASGAVVCRAFSGAFTGTERFGLVTNFGTGNAEGIRVFHRQAASTSIACTMVSNGVSDNDWHHYLWMIDMDDQDKCKVYIDGVDATFSFLTFVSGATLGHSLYDYTMVGAQTNFSGTASSSLLLNAEIADLWLGFGQWIDVTDASFRARFRSAAGCPVSLGQRGVTPTGIAPQIYLSGGIPGWAKNLGSGGQFNVSAVLPAQNGRVPC